MESCVWLKLALLYDVFQYVLVETFIYNAKGEMWGHTYPEAALLVPGTGA